MACVAIGFTNLDQPGELGFPLAVAVFGINCWMDRCVLVQLLLRRVLQLVFYVVTFSLLFGFSHVVFNK